MALRTLPRAIVEWVEPNLRDFGSSRQLTIWALAFLVGITVATAAIAFREAIGAVQWLWLGTRAEDMLDEARAAAWWLVLLTPIVGGAVVGLGLQFLTTNKRTGGVPDVIEARVSSREVLPLRDGVLSAGLAAVSLGAGASAGREGPLVHLGATLSDAIVRRFDLSGPARRTLLGCGVAAAVSASFNAPIAGVLFAHEVVLGHYAQRAFVPIVIASTLAALGSRLWFGEDAAFDVPAFEIVSYLEFPAFALLGVVAALVAIAFQFALFSGEVVARRTQAPAWLLPIIGGAVVGSIAVFFPEVLGVGYSTVDDALRGLVALDVLVALIALKMVATAASLGFRFGGGIFSPSLYLGAVTGAAFGQVATGVASPEVASEIGLYALLGMGAVAGAVLGAPISTAVIVFELTGGYALSIALLLSVAIAHGINHAIHDHSYFQWQLEQRGLFIQSGPHRTIGRTVRVMDFMALPGAEADERREPDAGEALRPSDTLERALRSFDASGERTLPVVDPGDPTRIVGQCSQVEALERFNKALIAASVEEHR